jgi:hypothetical protein
LCKDATNAETFAEHLAKTQMFGQIKSIKTQYEMACDRLLKVVLSFYREEPRELLALEPLRDCRFSKGWSALRIECCDLAHLEEVNDLVDLLRHPLAVLQLARQIRLTAPGVPERVFPVRLPFFQDEQTSTAE